MKYSLRSLITFSIRDLFWLTIVVALVVVWWLDRTKLATEEGKRQKAEAAYKESAAIVVEIVEELEKRGVSTYRVKGKTVIAPESAFAR
jgi:membrane protein implicated in regulation of membrane protease activity